MESTEHGWQVIDSEAGVLSLTYNFSDQGSANCFTLRLPGGGLVLISPPARITGGQLNDLGLFGKVEALVANNGLHYLGLASWRARFPKARCFAARQAGERIMKKSDEVGDLEPLSALTPLLGDTTAVVEAPGNKLGETWAWAEIEGGYAWYASDLLANMPKLPSSFVPRVLFKLTKSAPGYKVFNLALKFVVKDKRAALEAMLADLRAHPPTVMVPGHGDILSGESLAADTEKLVEGAL